MTHAVELETQRSQKLNKFREFIFISDSGMKFTPDSPRKIVLAPDSNLLNRLKVGDLFTVEQIYAPRKIIQQLKTLKLKPNSLVQLVSKTSSGSVIVNLNNTLIGMGQEIAQRIVVHLEGDRKS